LLADILPVCNSLPPAAAVFRQYGAALHKGYGDLNLLVILQAFVPDTGIYSGNPGINQRLT